VRSLRTQARSSRWASANTASIAASTAGSPLRVDGGWPGSGGAVGSTVGAAVRSGGVADPAGAMGDSVAVGGGLSMLASSPAGASLPPTQAGSPSPAASRRAAPALR
jgi:hypothetical protein